MAILLHSLFLTTTNPSQRTSPNPQRFLQKPLHRFKPSILCNSQPSNSHAQILSNRNLALRAATAAAIFSLTLTFNLDALASKSNLPVISSTREWSRFVGNGFSIRVPPQFEDIMEPEDYTAGLSLYGDKAKPKTLAARFASPDRSEILSVVVRPSNQLKITFLEAKDITELGSLKDAAKIFVPAGATIDSARALKIKEDEGLKTYYFYEFRFDDQHVALVAAVNSGKAFIAGAAAPQLKWEGDGVKLRSAAISMSVL